MVIRTLPAWIELRRERITGSWSLVCRACGVKEAYGKFWPASYAAHEHADMHAAELDERIEAAQLRWLGRQAGLVSQSEDVLAGVSRRGDLAVFARLPRSAFDLDLEGL